MELYKSLNKHLTWSHSLSILLVINKIRPAFLLLGATPSKLNKISKIVKDMVFIKTIEFKPKKYFTLFYLEPLTKKIIKYSENPNDRELLGKILGYGCPWKNNRKAQNTVYVYTTEVMMNDTADFDDLITYVCDKPSKVYEKQQVKQALLIKDLTKHLGSYNVITKVTKQTTF